MSKRIMMFTERFAPDIGGVARSASRTALRLNEIGYQCEVFSWTKSLPPGELESSLQTIGDQQVLNHRLGLFANFDFSMQHTVNVMAWLHQQHPINAIWGHYLYPSGFVAVMLAKLLVIPSVVSARGNDIDRLMFPPGDFARLEWTLGNADQVTAVSQDLANKIHAIVPAVDSMAIRNTVDAETFSFQSPKSDDDFRESMGIYPNERILGFCGELRHKKGLPFLLSALQQVRSNRAACLLVIGEIRSREHSAIFEYLRDDEESRKRILVTGHLESEDAVAAHLSQCDVVLLPSVWDGLPNALLEAMSCERVVIASDAGGMPEVVEHKVDGFLIPKAHLNRLGEATLEVLNAPPNQLQEIGARARRKILESFHPDRERAELASLMERLIPKASS